jgi:hypothetical protein
MKKLVLIFFLTLAFGLGTALLAPAPFQDFAYAQEKKKQAPKVQKTKGMTYQECMQQKINAAVADGRRGRNAGRKSCEQYR